MLFRQNSCRKSQKGVYLHRIKSQKGANMEVQKSQKGADDITMKRKIYQQLRDCKGQGTGPCPASSFFVTFEIIFLNIPAGQ